MASGGNRFQNVRRIYSAIIFLLLPIILGRVMWRSRRRGYPFRLKERLAFYDTQPVADVLWFHAVSVGEAEAAFPVIKSFQKRQPATPLLVTCTTPSGSARIREVLGDSVLHVFLPYDLPGAVTRFLTHFRPAVGVILETEIWPNLFHACHEMRVPLTIINARLSERSASGYQRLKCLTRDSLSAVALIAAQTRQDALRFIGIGTDADKVVVAGNVKFDIEFDDAMKVHSTALRSELFPGRPVWIAGSTHPGEEELMLDALAGIRDVIPDILLIMAPRHPDRGGQIQALCEKRGYRVRRRSEKRPCDPETGVFMIDTLGELRAFYGAADAAFVGGSLVPCGGHNVLEPAMAGLPVLFGPHMFNFAEIAANIIDSGGGLVVHDSQELTNWVRRLLTDPETARAMGSKGRAFVDENRGAVARVTALIQTLSARSEPLTPGDCAS